jgi:iron complex outermembrane receptor protein
MNSIPTFRAYLVVAVIFFCQSVMAQSGTISGKISDEKNEPLTGAVAELRNASDSTLAKVNVADVEGKFSFTNVKQGDYYLKTTLTGFNQYSGSAFTYDGSSHKELTAVKMSVSTTTLKQAEVSAIKPLIEIRSDKTVFNVENSISSVGSTAYELLQKAPGVVVDNNDNVSLKGRGGVLVQIDGKDMRLSSEELGNYLRSIQSTDVESIELISNPSSKYDAAGTGGIINIKLKKNKNFGTNGSLSLAYATQKYSKYTTSASLNNRSKKFNLYSNYGLTWGTRQNEFYLYREQPPYIMDQGSITKRSGPMHNYKAGVDYYMNTKNTLGVMVIGNFSNIDGTTESDNNIKNFETLETDSILHSDQTITNVVNNINLNLNHHYSDTLGHDLTTDFDYGYYDGERNNYQPNIYTTPDGITVLGANYYRSITPTVIKILTLKSDYSQNLWKGKLGLGYKISRVNTDNIYDFYNIEGDIESFDLSRSNHFVYTENVNALYLNYQHTIKKFDLQTGVRMENTGSIGNLISASANTVNKKVKRDYTDFFPSAGITYNANKDNSIGLIYSSRIDRPNYQELNPFVFKLDELSYRKGNPFLDPQYSNTFELSHTYKYTITTSVSYSHTRDYFAQITDTLPDGISFITTENLASEDVIGGNVGGSLQPLKWYSLYFNAGVYNQAYDADFGNGKTINTSVTAFNFYAQNTIKLPMNFSFEISGWYSSGGVWGGSFVTDEQGSLDLGMQKKLFHEQATFKLAYTDVLNTAPWNSYNTYGGIVIKAHGNWESQLFRASFTWNFGNRQMKNSRQRASGSESEQKRISGGD